MNVPRKSGTLSGYHQTGTHRTVLPLLQHIACAVPRIGHRLGYLMSESLLVVKRFTYSPRECSNLDHARICVE